MAFAYVHFIRDKIRRVVPTQDIREYEGYIVSDRKYKVKFKNDEEDVGAYYKAYLISLGETKQEALTLGEVKRFRVPKELEFEESATTQDDYSAGNSCDISSKPKKGKKNKILSNYDQLMQEIVERPVSSGSKTDSGSIDGNQHSKTKPISIQLKNQKPKEIWQLKTENMKLKEENSELKKTVEKLTKLNFKLQTCIIDKFEKITSVNVNDEATASQDTPGNLSPGVRKGDQVHVGNGIWLPATILDNIWRRNKNSMFLKELAVALFGSATLINSTVAGNGKKPRLDPTRLLAMQVAYKKWQEERGQDGTNKKQSFDRILNEKIQDMRRPPRKPKNKKKSAELTPKEDRTDKKQSVDRVLSKNGQDIGSSRPNKFTCRNALLEEMEKAKLALDGDYSEGEEYENENESEKTKNEENEKDWETD